MTYNVSSGTLSIYTTCTDTEVGPHRACTARLKRKLSLSLVDIAVRHRLLVLYGAFTT